MSRFNENKVNIEVFQGETYIHTFNYKYDNDANVPLSGYTASIQIRLSEASGTYIYKATDAEDALTINDGQVILKIPSATTTAWTFKKAIYGIELTNAAGEVEKLAWGTVKLKHEVNK